MDSRRMLSGAVVTGVNEDGEKETGAGAQNEDRSLARPRSE